MNSLKPSPRSWTQPSRDGALLAILVIGATLGVHFLANAGRLCVGGDEGMELLKVLLLQRRPDLLPMAWNDQPWFFSKMLSILGTDVRLPRLAVAVTFMVGVAGMASLMGSLTCMQGLVMAVCFVGGPGVLMLSIAVMPEFPAISMAIASAALFPGPHSRRPLGGVVASGIAFAIGVHIKLTAMIVLPAILAHMWVSGSHRRCSSTTWRRVVSWACPAMFAWIVLSPLSPEWNMDRLLMSHAAASQTPQAQMHGFSALALMATVPGTCVAAALGTWVLLVQGRASRAVFPLALFATGLLVHTFHRPYWFYYHVHFGVPLAMLACHAVQGDPKTVSAGNLAVPCNHGIARSVFSLRDAAGLAAAALFVCVDLQGISRHAPPEDWAVSGRHGSLVSEIGKYGALAKWGYSRNGIILHAAGVLAPPELVVVPRKRTWTHGMTERQLVDVVARYDCEVVVLEPDQVASPEWEGLLKARYIRVLATRDHFLFVAKRLQPKVVDADGSARSLGNLGL